MDSRIEKLAENIVSYSCNLKEGEKVLIEASVGAEDLVKALIKKVHRAKAYPFVTITNSAITREILNGIDETHAKLMAKYDLLKFQELDAYIGINASKNSFELSSVPSKNMEIYNVNYSGPIHRDIRVTKTKWVIMKYPTESLAQQSSMSTDEFRDYYFEVCTLDYAKMKSAMKNLKTLMEKTDRVKIVSPNTDLTFSIKGIPAVICAGEMNIPDGEIYTAPIKESVNGKITFNCPTIYNGKKMENVMLEFKNGKIINATSSDTENLNKILDTDDGARFIGEFAIGVNPFITQPMCDILFDEKITGSIHFTPGCCYDDAFNGNKSAIHWDMVLIQNDDFGGGEIYFDDVLIRKNGKFVLEELLPLNPENLI